MPTKRFASVLLALLLAMAAAACGETDRATSEPEAQTTQAAPAEPEGLAEPAASSESAAASGSAESALFENVVDVARDRAQLRIDEA